MATKNNPVWLLFCLAVLCITGCEQQSNESEWHTTQDGQTAIAPVPDFLQHGMPEDRSAQMLAVTDSRQPAFWLVSLNEKEAINLDKTEQYYRHLLENIATYVHEDHRVIANRVVQSSKVLEEQGIDAHWSEILQGFSDAATDVSGPYVFGDLCSNYTNLRQQHHSHADAMHLLFELL